MGMCGYSGYVPHEYFLLQVNVYVHVKMNVRKCRYNSIRVYSTCTMYVGEVHMCTNI